MARAINSLPTPDSPSISTGILDLAARSPRRTARDHLLAARKNVAEGQVCRSALRPMRRISPSSASKRRAFLIEICSLSAPTGLTTKSSAPARMAEITASIEPCAVWTITGIVDLEVAHPRQHAHAVEIGHDEIENQQIDMGLVGGLHARQRGLAALDTYPRDSRNGAPWLREAGAGRDRRRRSERSRSSLVFRESGFTAARHAAPLG